MTKTKILILYGVIFLAGVFACDNYSPALAASYTVCNSGCDYTTIAAAHTAITTGAANTITVKATYTANETVTISKSGAIDANRLTLQVNTGDTINIKGISVSGNYVTVNGFHISNATPTADAGAYTAWIGVSGNYVTISNNYLVAAALASEVAIGVAVSNGNCVSGAVTNLIFSGNDISNVGGNTDNAGQGGVSVVSLANNSLYFNNYFHSCSADVFYIWGHDTIFRGNEVANFADATNHGDFFQTFDTDGDDTAHCPAYNIIIEKNFVHDSKMQPGNVETDGSSQLHDWIIRNNVFATIMYTMNVGIPYVQIYNNTFYNVGYYGALAVSVMTGGNFPGDHCTIKNNIFIGGTQSDYYAGIYDGSGAVSFTAANNYVASLTYTGKDNRYPGTNDVNGGNPHLVNVGSTAVASNFSVTSSSTILIDHALTISGLTPSSFNFTDDYVGTTRGATWDIGAYEYTGASDTTPPAAPMGLMVN